MTVPIYFRVVAQHYTRAPRRRASPGEMPFFCHISPAAFPFPDVVPPYIGASMAFVQIARQPLGDDMNNFSNCSLAGPRTPALSMARDVVRMVITAVLAGTGFALLLALAVLSLTVIAPPAHASGAPPLASSEPGQGRGSVMQSSGKQDATPVHPADQPVGTPASLRRDSTHQGVFDSLPKTGTATSAALYLILALVAGFLVFFVYVLARRKS